MEKEYFKIMFVQKKLSLDYDREKEYLIVDNYYFKQADKTHEKVRDNDVMVFP